MQEAALILDNPQEAPLIAPHRPSSALGITLHCPACLCAGLLQWCQLPCWHQAYPAPHCCSPCTQPEPPCLLQLSTEGPVIIRRVPFRLTFLRLRQSLSGTPCAPAVKQELLLQLLVSFSPVCERHVSILCVNSTGTASRSKSITGSTSSYRD